MHYVMMILLVSSFIQAFSQKVKSIDLCHGPQRSFIASAHITEGLDTTFLVIGRNNRYTHLIDYITLKSGGKEEMIQFFTYCRDFLDQEDDGVHENYKGNVISVNKIMGVKSLWVYGEDDDGFTYFNLKGLNKLIACLSTTQ